MTTLERQELASRVKELRLSMKMDQAELAHLAKVSRQSVSNLERGTVPQEATLLKVLNVLGVEAQAVEFEPQTDLWLVTIGTLIESIPTNRRAKAVDESVQLLASHVRSNVTPFPQTHPTEQEALELDAVAKEEVREADEFPEG